MRQNHVAIFFFFGIFAVLAFWGTYFGRNERARYVGVQHNTFYEEGALLRTEPHSNYLMPRNENFRALKPNCVYKFNVEWEMGRRRDPNRIKRVRNAALVSC